MHISTIGLRSILSTGIDDDIISENLPCRLSYSYSFATRGAGFIMLFFFQQPTNQHENENDSTVGPGQYNVTA